MKKIIFILLVFFISCSSEKPVLKISREKAKARDILEYGRELYNRERYKDAINEFRYVTTYFTNDRKECAWAQYELAYTYFIMKRYEEALTEFQKVESKYPEQSGPVILARKMLNRIRGSFYKK